MQLKKSDIEPELDLILYQAFTGDKLESPLDIPKVFLDFINLMDQEAKKYAVVKHYLEKGYSQNRIKRDCRVSSKTITKISKSLK